MLDLSLLHGMGGRGGRLTCVGWCCVFNDRSDWIWGLYFSVVCCEKCAVANIKVHAATESKVARLGFEPRSAGPKPTMMDPYTIELCKSVGGVPLFVFVGFGFTAKAHGRQVFFERSQ